MKIRRQWACITRKNFIQYSYDVLKGNDQKTSKRIATIQNGIWKKKSYVIEEFDKMLEISNGYKLRAYNV